MTGVSGCTLRTQILIGKIKIKSKFEYSGKRIYEMQEIATCTDLWSNRSCVMLRYVTVWRYKFIIKLNKT